MPLSCGQTESLGTRPPTSCDLLDYESESAGAPQQVVSVATFWIDVEEHEAFNLLADSAGDSPYVVREIPRTDRVTQQISLSNWLLNDSDPLPDVFQVNGGSDVLQWADIPNPDETQLCPLDRLAVLHGWQERFFPATLRPLTCKDSLYALPVGVHRLNTLLFNRELLEQLRAEAQALGLELKLPEDYRNAEDFLAALEVIAQLRTEADAAAVVPLAIGNQSGWPLTVLGFENLMVARDTETYETVWRVKSAQAPLPEGELRSRLTAWLGDLRALAALSNIGQRISWQEAVHLVADGEAAFTVMGDWALAQLSSSEAAGVEAMAFPGTGQAFVYTPDSFAVSRLDDSDGSGAHFWLQEVVANEDTQLEFSARKQSIPSLRELSPAALEKLGSPRQREQYRAFSECQEPTSSCRLLLAVSGLGPPPARDPCFDEIDRLLTRAVGAPSQDDLEESAAGEPRACSEPLEEEPRAAGEHVIEILLRVAQTRFADSCR